jgi:dihydroorotase
MALDLLIKSGLLIDPASGIASEMDVGIEGGLIASVEKSIPDGSAKRTIDARGLIVTPGMIDMHSHVARGVVRLCVDPDEAGLAHGCTTMVDAGSTGELLFRPFREFVIEKCAARVLSFLNIESLSMIEFVEGHPVPSDQEWSRLITDEEERFARLFVNIKNTMRVIAENSESIVGIKWAHHGLEPLALAREAADSAKTILMAENHYQPELTRYLRPGDIITHIYQDAVNVRLNRRDGIVEDSGRSIRPEVFDAVKRGVLLDVGHGRGSFSWRVAELAFREGLRPDTISTDLWVANVSGPVFDMPTTMAKFLHLGMTVEEVVRAVTAAPARALGRAETLGTIRVGSCADVCAFRLQEGRFPLTDSYGHSKVGDRMMRLVHVFRAGSSVDLAALS